MMTTTMNDDASATIPALGQTARSLALAMQPVRSEPTSALTRYKPRSFEDLLPTTGLCFEAEKKPLYLGSGQCVPHSYAVVRKDNDSVLGVVGEGYTITQPMGLARSLDAFFKDMPIELSGAMTVGEGRQLVLVAKLPREMSVVLKDGKDVTDAEVVFRTTFDGSGVTSGEMIGRRLVCTNGLRVHDFVPGTRWHVRHTRNESERRDAAVDTMRAWVSEWTRFRDAATFLSARQLSTAAVRETVRRIVLSPDEVLPAEGTGKKATPQQEKKIERIMELVEHGAGTEVPGIVGTAWGVLQAVNEFDNHYSPARGTAVRQAERRIERVLDGQGTLSARAFRVLTEA